MKVKGYIAATIVSILWGISFIATKVALSGLNPVGVMLIKFMIASVMFSVLFKVKQEKLPRTDIKLFIVSAFFGSFVYFFLEGNAINMLNASSASLILATEPVVIMVMSYFFVGERMNLIKRISIPVSILGVWLIVKGSSGDDSVLGYALMFGAILSWGAFVIISSKLNHKYSEVQIAGVQSFVALLMYLPLFGMVEVYTIGFEQILALLYIGIVPSGIALFLYLFSLKTIGNSTTSLFINFVPVVTSIIGILYLGETLLFTKVLGGAIVIIVIMISLFIDLKEENRLTK